MDSLANYGSDGDNSNNSEDTKMPGSKGSASLERRSSDANYDPVQMDMSEESNNNNSSEDSGTHSPAHETHSSSSRKESSRQRTSPTDQRRSDHETNASSSREDHHRSRVERNESRRSRERSSRSGRSSYEERRYRSDSARGESRESKKSRDDDRKASRELEERRRDRKSTSSCREDNRYEDRDRNDHRDDRRDRDRDRSERSHRRDRDRDRDRDRRQSRDERTKESRYRDDRSSRETKEKTRSRSRSKERASTMQSSFRAAMGRNKLAQLEKLGIELKPPVGEPVIPAIVGEPNYYNPLATATQGKYAEQIQKRKLLWANKSKQEEGKTATGASTANTWMGTTFTHDQDGKVTAKFKRLMGIKDDTPIVSQQTGNKPDILKKQEEMFNNMEQQYEVARATTHTQRGVGLGYATGGYQFPR
ncbi:arginine/serine-rich coiled-coil protein 2-like [Venturia canescens]|uniref:arginine/serine-rich coiled-coil protein 2-like n=1 Tax=Venturia canescens TaxID=32260 RepID=UPI001C9D0501|nr:arginine/serine-rich coiled-coil protein 2-like [Venturia canescens]